jgi:hypothetical protein
MIGPGDALGAAGRASRRLSAQRGTSGRAQRPLQHRKPSACGDRKVPDSRRDASGGTAMLLDRRRGIADDDRQCQESEKDLDRSRVAAGNDGAEGALPASTDVDGLNRFYLSVFQRLAIRPQDGATPVELRGLAAGPWLLGRARVGMLNRNGAGLGRFPTDMTLGASEKR